MFFKLVGSKYSFALLLVLGEQIYYTRVDILKYDYMTHVYKNSLLKKTCIQNPYSTEHGGETT